MTAVEDVAARSDEELVTRKIDELLAAHPPATTEPAAVPGCPVRRRAGLRPLSGGYGGLGLSRQLQSLIADRLRQRRRTRRWACRNPIGYGMAAPTILTLGSEAQRQRYLRPLFTCEEIWCQLFSEPGAGSDVASLATRAERDGDEWIINGQKVWTTLAHTARFGMVLARTDPEAEKHKGITYFVVDMHAPGVEVRPLRQTTGDAEFNEVYFTDVRIPDSERLGDVGDGWRGAIVTLMNERVSIGGAVAPPGSGPIGTAVSLWKQPARDRRDPVTRDRLMRLWVEAEVQRLTNPRAAANSKPGTPGPEGSTGQAGLRRAQQAHLRPVRRPARARGHALRQLRDAPAGRARGGVGARCSGCSSGPGPTPSRAAPRRSCATSWASGCWASRRHPDRQGGALVPGAAQLTEAWPPLQSDGLRPAQVDLTALGLPRPRWLPYIAVAVEGERPAGRSTTSAGTSNDPLESSRLRAQAPQLEVDVVVGVDDHVDQARRSGRPRSPGPAPPWLRSRASATCSRATSRVTRSRSALESRANGSNDGFRATPACGSGPGRPGRPPRRAGSPAAARSRSGRRCAARGPPC